MPDFSLLFFFLFSLSWDLFNTRDINSLICPDGWQEMSIVLLRWGIAYPFVRIGGQGLHVFWRETPGSVDRETSRCKTDFSNSEKSASMACNFCLKGSWMRCHFLPHQRHQISMMLVLKLLLLPLGFVGMTEREERPVVYIFISMIEVSAGDWISTQIADKHDCRRGGVTLFLPLEQTRRM